MGEAMPEWYWRKMAKRKPVPYDVIAPKIADLLATYGYVTKLGKPLDVIRFRGTWIIGDGHGDPENVLRDLELHLPGLPDSLARMTTAASGRGEET